MRTQTEQDRERAMDWYATNPPEAQACPTMFAGDAIAIYAAGLANERARIAEMLRADAVRADEDFAASTTHEEAIEYPAIASELRSWADGLEDGTL